MNVPELTDAEQRLRPLEEARNLSEWNLYADATEEHEEAATASNLAYETALADPALRADAQRALETAADADERRAAVMLDLATEAAQRPPDLLGQIVELETTVTSRFSAYRAEYDGRSLSDNEVDDCVSHSVDVAERQAVWESARAVGAVVGDDLRRLVHLRNEAARRLGARDHYALSLRTSEIDEDWLLATLDDLDAKLAPAFASELAAMHAEIRARFSLGPADTIYPWHFGDRFFQSPTPPDRDPLDGVVAELDVVEVSRRYYADLGHDVTAILDRSDLYPRERKHQHAFCAAITRTGDIRVSCNVSATPRWLETMLHELGHAVYDDVIDADVPWLLRSYSHLLTTEAIAMLQGSMNRDPVFLERYAGAPQEVSRDPANDVIRRRFLLVFAQWVQVMVRFERTLYADPDGDLATTWWDLAERYQRLTRPPGPRPHDWASKVHLTSAPVYYHNYLLGEVTAAQLGRMLAAETGAASPAVHPAESGRLLRDRYMRYGARLRWDELIAQATGDPLTVDAFVAAASG
jgi:peptidyl-dipeptidase A